MRLGLTSFIHFISKAAGSLIGFLATIYFARVLGAEVLGLYSLTIAVVSWIGLGGEMGITTAITKRMSEVNEGEKYFLAGLFSIVGFSVVVSVLVILFQQYIDTYVGATVAGYVIILLVVRLFYSSVGAGLKGQHKVHIQGVLEPFWTTTRSLCQIVLVVLGFGLGGMFVGYAVGGVLAISVGAVFLSVDPDLPKYEDFRQIFSYAQYSWLGQIKSKSHYWMDLLILGAFVTPRLVGIYSVAWSLASFLSLFGKSIKETLFPEMSKSSVNGNRLVVSRLLEDGLGYGGLILFPGLAGGYVISDELLRIYGPEFTEGSIVFVILILSTVFYGYQAQLLKAISAINRPDIAFRINAVFILCNIILNVSLIYLYGWIGAAVATTAAAFTAMLLSYWQAKQLINFKLPVLRIGKQIVAAGFMGVAVLLFRDVLNKWDPLRPEVTAAILVLSGAFLYFGMLLVISEKFRTTVQDNITTVFSH